MLYLGGVIFKVTSKYTTRTAAVSESVTGPIHHFFITDCLRSVNAKKNIQIRYGIMTIRWIRPFHGVKAFGVTGIFVAMDSRITAAVVMMPAARVHP